jgi:hypothetical protein
MNHDIAVYLDYIGIEGSLVDHQFVFDAQLSSLKVNARTSLKVSFQLTIQLPIYSLIRITYQSTAIISVNSNCQLSTLQSIYCESQAPVNGLLTLEVTLLESLGVGSYEIEFSGILLSVSGPQTITVDFEFMTKLLTGEIVQVGQVTKTFTFTCTHPCKLCSTYHSRCDACSSPMLLF